MTLLFRLVEWHALAKLRIHMEHTLNHLNQTTITIGQELQSFQAWTRGFNTVELPCETAAREHRRWKKATLENATNSLSLSQDHPASSRSEKTSAQSKVKYLNLLTYKFHVLGDYVQIIKIFGTTDSYSE
jgi:hypothetical protein